MTLLEKLCFERNIEDKLSSLLGDSDGERVTCFIDFEESDIKYVIYISQKNKPSLAFYGSIKNLKNISVDQLALDIIFQVK
jgi:hypothetical protein